jgi:hypothetical protein
MTEIFGGDVADCVSVLATFCDGGPVLVTNALAGSESFQQIKKRIPESKDIVYKFNNSAIFVDPKSSTMN